MVDVVHDRLIPVDRLARPPAPGRTWDFDRFESWRGVAWDLVRDFADRKVRQAFLASSPECVASDDLGWLDAIIRAVHRREVDSKAELADRLMDRYDALRAVHGTRTDDVGRFYAEGIRPLVPATIHERAREIFLGGAFPELTQADLDRAIAAVGARGRQGLAYFDTRRT